MIEHSDAKNLTGLDELILCFQVGIAGLQIAGRMIVSKDHCSGAVGDDVGKYITRVNQAFVEQANGNEPLFD